MGTAGHVDHGKTSLVKALTGIDCDRLAEEKKRGITIELGFAYLDLPGGGRLSIVDVPGHERFVKNMVAGAAGMDFVMLVVAADEGVMPQTREHLEICALLGIRHGLVALTKADMAEADWLGMVQEDIRNFLRGSFLEHAAIYQVSAQTGQGLPALRLALTDMEVICRPKRRGEPARMPVDRVFSLRGHGTVVTGTLISGNFVLGEDLQLMPSDAGSRISKARGLQTHGLAVELAQAGFRVAVNLPMLEVAEIRRGDVLTRPGSLFAAKSWIVRLQCLSSAPKALRHRGEMHFHHEAKETQARIYFFDRDKLLPGESALCQIRFDEPMVGVFGDRFVLRSFSPLRTVGGGLLVHPLELDLRKRDPGYGRWMRLLLRLAGDVLEPEEAVACQLSLRGLRGATFAQLCVLVNFESDLLEKTLRRMGGKQQVFLVDKEERLYLSGEEAGLLGASCLEYLEKFHKNEPLQAGIGRGAMFSGWGKSLGPGLVQFVLECLIRQGRLVADGEILHLPDHSVSLRKEASALRTAVRDAYVKAGLMPPNLSDVLEELGTGVKDAWPVLKIMQAEGELVKLTESLYYAAEVLARIQEMVAAWFSAHDNLELTDLKKLTGGLSRKYLIALLEYFDKSRLTMRIGNKRVLRGVGRQPVSAS
jgi:selenocysteine-specific elongation factor